MGSFPITADGFERLRVELKQLKNEEQPAVIRQSRPASMAIYRRMRVSAARERQSFIEGRIASWRIS